MMTDRRTFLSWFKDNRSGIGSQGWIPQFWLTMADHFYGFATVALEDEGDNHDSMVFEHRC
jgi:hypothetical protein